MQVTMETDACVNSGHQALFFPLLAAPGTRLDYDMSTLYIYRFDPKLFIPPHVQGSRILGGTGRM